MKNGEKFEEVLNKQFGRCFACNVRAAMNNSIGTYGCLDPKNESDQDKVCAMCLHESLEWLHAEYKEPVPLLNDKEKRIIRLMVNMIAYFGKETLFVELNKNSSGYFLTVAYKGVNGSFVFCPSPYFDHTKMFTGMKENVEYTLKDLGL